MRFCRLSVFAFVTAVLSACGGGEAEPPVYSQTDSAGIRLVQHRALPERTAFTLGEPLYRHGWRPGDVQFSRLYGGAVLSDGRVAATDLDTGELILLAPDGELDTILAGKGEGPGELGSPVSVHALPGDTLLVEDDGNMRLAYFHGDALARTFQLEGFAPFMSMTVGVADRVMIGMPTAYRPYFDEPWLSMPLLRQPLDSNAPDTLAMYDFVARAIQGQPNNPFRPRGAQAVSGNAVLVARGDRAEVRALDVDTGEPTRIIRWQEAPRPMTDEFWESYATGLLERVGGDRVAEAETQLANSRPLAEGPLPFIGDIWGDDVGRVWVGQYDWGNSHPNRIKVFAADGEWLGTVDLPARVQIVDITERYLLGIERDEFDVQALVLWELR